MDVSTESFEKALDKIRELSKRNSELLNSIKKAFGIAGNIPEDNPNEDWGDVNQSIQKIHDILDDAIQKAKEE